MNKLRKEDERDREERPEEKPWVIPVTPDLDEPRIIPALPAREIKKIINDISRDHMVWDGHLSRYRKKPDLPS